VNIQKQLCLLAILLISGVSACGLNKTIVPTNSNSGDSQACIPALETFAYTTSTEPGKQVPNINFFVAPKEPWILESQVPTSNSISEIPIYGQGVDVTRKLNDRMEVWVQNFRLDNQSLKFAYDYSVYNTKTKEWENRNGILEDSSAYAVKLFVDNNGLIWGQNSSDQKGNALLSRWNDTSRLFEPDNDTKNIPAYESEDDNGNWLAKRSSIILFDNARSLFWVLAHKDGIYSYNIESHVVQKFINLDKSIKNAVLSTDGSIYYNVFQDESGDHQVDVGLRHFSIQKGIETVYTNLDLRVGYSNILVDHSGSLWLDAAGWKSSDGNWHQIQPSPIFITNRKQGASDHRWRMPFVQLESSDGRLWFSSDNGMAWLDPIKGEWCWFTTYQTFIEEDPDHNLWMIADGKLYKNPVQP
jgi:hypothetical protein